VATLLASHRDEIAARLGAPLVLAHVADIDLGRQRGVDLSGVRQSHDYRALVADPEVDIVIELVGGMGVARDIVLAAIEAGKGVVTANKALLARCGPELYAAAAKRGVEILFEASVAGTIPVLRALREGLCADRIESVHGIVNGTCNFILTEMEEYGETYAACLKRAQDLGFAELDPTFDVDGTDSAHKLCILMGLALGVRLDVSQVSVSGIERIEPVDLEYAQQFGLRIKLLAVGKRGPSGIEARVEPTMILRTSVLAGVSGAMNAVEVRGVASGPTLYCGAGAGALPTASAVVSDVMEMVRSRRAGIGIRVPPLGREALAEPELADAGSIESELYVRFSVADRPGVLAQIMMILAEHGISMASVLQPERHAAHSVPVVIMTHATLASSLREAVEQIRKLEHVHGTPQVLRIERDL
jgi:homoserine dehydrogenase